MKLILLPLAIAALFSFSATAQANSNYAVGGRAICALSYEGTVVCATAAAFNR